MLSTVLRCLPRVLLAALLLTGCTGAGIAPIAPASIPAETTDNFVMPDGAVFTPSDLHAGGIQFFQDDFTAALNAFARVAGDNDKGIQLLSGLSHFPVGRMTVVGRVGRISQQL